jgi:hypothetical protein
MTSPAALPAGRVFAKTPRGQYFIRTRVYGRWREAFVKPLFGFAYLHELIKHAGWPLPSRALIGLDDYDIHATEKLAREEFTDAVGAAGFEVETEDGFRAEESALGMSVRSVGQEEIVLRRERTQDSRRYSRWAKDAGQKRRVLESQLKAETSLGKIAALRAEISSLADVEAFLTPDTIREVWAGETTDSRKAYDAVRNSRKIALRDKDPFIADPCLRKYFRERIVPPGRSAHLRWTGGWIFRDDDFGSWHVTPIPVDEQSADGVFKRMGDGWRVRWNGTDALLSQSKGVEYIARILEQRRTPCGLLQRKEETESSIVPQCDRLFRPGSPLLRYGISPADLRVTMPAVWKIWKKLTKSRADAFMDGKKKLYDETNALVSEIETALYFVTRRLDSVPKIGPWSELSRSAVSHAIGDAILEIRTVLPTLADHFETSLKRGLVCSYEGDAVWFIEGLTPFPIVRDLADEFFYLKAQESADWDSSWAEECGGHPPLVKPKRKPATRREKQHV